MIDMVFEGLRRPYTGPLRAVILDWAGTTVDYGSFAPVVVFMEVFRRQGVEMTPEQAREPMGLAKLDHIRAITRQEPVARAWEELKGHRCTEADVEAMYASFIPLQMAALVDYADPIPGAREAVAEFRLRGLKIGSTTGYNRQMMELLVPEARRRGYEPDAWTCPDDVAAGRPYPWMCYRNAIALEVYPLEACVKIGDTLPDIAEGLNAGMWTIGLAKTGNELGLREQDVRALAPDRLAAMLSPIYARMRQAGAHYVVDSIADVPPILDDIAARLESGGRP